MRGIVLFSKAWHLEQSQWLTDRYGTAKCFIETNIREGFEAGYMTSSGRWELDKLKTAVARLEGQRMAAGAPMHVG